MAEPENIPKVTVERPPDKVEKILGGILLTSYLALILTSMNPSATVGPLVVSALSLGGLLGYEWLRPRMTS